MERRNVRESRRMVNVSHVTQSGEGVSNSVWAREFVDQWDKREIELKTHSEVVENERLRKEEKLKERSKPILRNMVADLARD
jgi:hypothetical protein